MKNSNKLYFALDGDTSMYVLGKNKEGRYILARDRFLKNGTVANAVGGLSMIGDVLWASVATTVSNVWSLTRSLITSETLVYTGTSAYTTSINPNMPIADRYKNKQLEAVQVSYTVGTNSANKSLTLKYSVDGSTMTSVIADTYTAGDGISGEKVTESTNEITNSLALLAGREFQFKVESTGGIAIKEIRYKYSILNSQL